MIAGLIILTTFVGLFAFLGVQTNKDGRQDSAVNNLKIESQMFKTEIYEILMNVSSSHTTTIVQNGTFEWVGRNSMTPPVVSNYTLNYVQVGPLGFNLLVLNPPAVPLTIILPNWYFILQNFNPIINQLLVIPQGDIYGSNAGPALIRLSTSNVKKMQITGDCLNLGTCYISGTKFDIGPEPTKNALIFDIIESFDNPSDYYLTAYLYADPPEIVENQAFTITSPWEWVLPVS